MIHPHSNETQTRWDRGEFQVQLNQPGNPRPIGFCDGTAADESQLRERAEMEGEDEIEGEMDGTIEGEYVIEGACMCVGGDEVLRAI